jgi:6-pyruvoyl-tetrahydropterin synthase
MINTLTFPQEMIDSIQERIEVLEKCLNDANSQDEAVADMIELSNSRQVSLSQLTEEFKQFREKFLRSMKLCEIFIEKGTQGEVVPPAFVRYNFLQKEIVEEYWDFFIRVFKIETIKKQTIQRIDLYQLTKNEDEFGSDKNVEKYVLYILLETQKHVLQTLIKASLRVNALTEEEINTFNLGDITPQVSEAMLISLASTKKWDYVYRKLA